ncbi:TetR family transcriptional regulator [Saccharibacillus sp. O23]|uniref:TetR/AcrR family transcriptional regulator n=1 Tax=Saccharibacillus sp. O23 TaxID=2009338 RepID=UPI000B4E6BDC|nr:TetR/AcrR family transcriptional regulator [Saccharibacillus sp. O23]OWR29858.1 TetR family transcriptional regulator [Saccharibacillus sp. O23]
MDGFQRRKEKKKQAILSGALALCMRSGFQNTTVAEVAAEAGVSKVTIFNYFGSKEELIREVVVYWLTEMYERSRAIVESDRDFETKMQQLMFMKSHEMNEYSRAFIDEIMEEFSRSDSRIQELYMKQGVALYEKLFAQGKEEGVIAPNISLAAMMVYLNVFSEGMRHKSVYDSVIPFTQEIMDMFLYGLAGRGNAGRERTTQEFDEKE